MDKNLSIPAYRPSNDILDFDFLKQKGIESIQRYSGKKWTDFNAHDPGVTILEALCFALTELGYRCRYPINDLLRTPNDKGLHESLSNESDILFTKPLTANDYRKILLDFDDVRNAFVFPDYSTPDFNGIWKILVELMPNVDQHEAAQRIKAKLHQNRNLCEDFSEIEFVDYEYIKFVIELEIEKKTDIKYLTHQVFGTIEDNLNPTINYYGLNELLNNGHYTDELFEGPKLQNGIVLEDELNNLQQKDRLYASDMYRLLMDIPGISYVRKLRMIDSKGKSHKWVYPIEKGKSATLDIGNVDVKFFFQEKQFYQHFDATRTFDKAMYYVAVKSKHKKLKHKIDLGELRNVEEYTSIQNDLPEVYGVGGAGLPLNSSQERIAQSRQLKAYLAVFDQLNANFLIQLRNLSNLFSVEPIKQTYYSRLLKDIPNMELLFVPFIQKCQAHSIDISDKKKVKEFWNKEKENVWTELDLSLQQIIESNEDFSKRRNKILDHLLSRFSYSFDHYYNVDEETVEDPSVIINQKIEILKNIQKISCDRNLALNLKDIHNIEVQNSGFHFRLQKKIGISAPSISINKEWQIMETEPETIEEHYFDVFETNRNDALKLIFQWGDDFNNFVIEPFDDKFKILLSNMHRQIADYSAMFNTKEEAEKEAERLCNDIKKQNIQFETVYYFEHLVLRPPDAANAFHFKLVDDEGKNILSNNQALTIQERADLLKEVLKFGQNPDNYSLIDMGYKQYKYAILNNTKSEIIQSNMFFHKENEVHDAITNAVSCIKKIIEGKVSREKYLTEYCEVIRPDFGLDDVYSNMITYLLPNWPKRFQGENNRSRIEIKLIDNTPAHLYANIKWLNYDELIDAVNLYNQILQLPKDNTETANTIYSLQKELFATLI